MTSFPDKFVLFPKPLLNRVEIALPGSKSYTNRALLLAALAKGRSTLSNALDSDDTNRMVDALNSLGVTTHFDKPSCTIGVQGEGGPSRVPDHPIDCGNAGTAIRFLTPFCCFAPGPVTLTGNGRMQERPIADLLEGLRQIGAKVVDTRGTGCPPIDIEGGGLMGGICHLRGDRSSQYFSALLMNAPLMREGIVLSVEGDLVSKPYIDMTFDIMARFGIEAINSNYEILTVPPGQTVNPLDYEVEGDASGASYFLAAAAISGTTVSVGPLPSDTKQGDRDLVLLLEEMGCTWKQVGNRIELTGGPLKGISCDMHGMSDVAQTLAVVALFAEGPTTIRNIANARIKETDRISAMATELTRLGARVEEFPDGLTIHPTGEYHPTEIETYEDHRMAMSFAVAGIRIPGLALLDPGCVSKTFPDFFDRFGPWVEVNGSGNLG